MFGNPQKHCFWPKNRKYFLNFIKLANWIFKYLQLWNKYSLLIVLQVLSLIKLEMLCFKFQIILIIYLFLGVKYRRGEPIKARRNITEIWLFRLNKYYRNLTVQTTEYLLSEYYKQNLLNSRNKDIHYPWKEINTYYTITN